MPNKQDKKTPRFFTYRQNNSGGSFVNDANKGISIVVVVEAYDKHHSNLRAQQIGLYFGGDGDCPCCGDRWSEA